MSEQKTIVISMPCQYCLSTIHTRIAQDKKRRCPVCGADYTGLRRSKEYRILIESGIYLTCKGCKKVRCNCGEPRNYEDEEPREL